jgi:hypothetical protein
MIDKKKEQKWFVHNLEYETDIDLIDKIINIYSFVEYKKVLTAQEKNTLRYYLNFGYSAQVRESIIQGLNINAKHLTQINHHLQKKGYLIRHATNFSEKIVSQTLINMRDMFLEATKNEKIQPIYAIFPVKIDAN